MPRCLVKQPDGRYAIWSTIVDSFIVVNCTAGEAVVEFLKDPRFERVGSHYACEGFGIELLNIERIGRAYGWAPTFDEALHTIEVIHGVYELEKMKQFIANDSLTEQDVWPDYVQANGQTKNDSR